MQVLGVTEKNTATSILTDLRLRGLQPMITNRYGERFNKIKNITIMTQQAINSIGLYRGNNPATIEIALRMQRSSVVKELMEHFGATSTRELAIKLSIG